MSVKKVFSLHYVVKTVLYRPKKATCKNEVLFDFCFFVLSSILAFWLSWRPLQGVCHLLRVSTLKKNICVCKKLEDGALLPVLLWIARFVTKLADGPVISSRAQTKFVWGPDGY